MHGDLCHLYLCGFLSKKCYRCRQETCQQRQFQNGLINRGLHVNIKQSGLRLVVKACNFYLVFMRTGSLGDKIIFLQGILLTKN